MLCAAVGLLGPTLILIRKAAAMHRKQQRTCVGECAAGGEIQTFPVCTVGDLQGVDALGDLLVGGFLCDH